MPKPYLLITINTRVDTIDSAFGKGLMEALCEEPRLVPELVSTSEICKDPFPGIDNFVERWWAQPAQMRLDGVLVSEFFWGPFWRRKSKLASRGMVDHMSRDKTRGLRPPGRIWFDCRWSGDVDFNRLFDAWVSLFRPEMAMMHMFTEPEFSLPPSQSKMRFEVGGFGGPKIPGIPNIGWAMAYGADNAQEVDVDRVKAAGFSVDTCGGATVVRVTDRLSDVVDDYPRFSQRRDELKSLFRPDLFRIKDEHGTAAPDPT